MQFQTQDGVLGSGVDPSRVNQMELASKTLQNNPVSSQSNSSKQIWRDQNSWYNRNKVLEVELTNFERLKTNDIE